MADITGFTQDCGENIDVQLIDDTFANAINNSITLRCTGASSVTQTSPPFTTCININEPFVPWTTLCIGGVNEQHACADALCNGCGPSTCSGVDWTNRIASPCSSSIMTVVQVQQSGISPLCCDDSGCIVANVGVYSCDATHSLLFCILDGGGSAECINTSNNAICSGNTTNFEVSPTSSGSMPIFGSPSQTTGSGASRSSGGGSETSGSAVNIQSTSTVSSVATSSSFSSTSQQTSSTDSSSGSGLSASDKATIAGSVVGGVASIVAIIGGIWQIRKHSSRRGG